MASETVVWWLGLSLPGSKEQGIMGLLNYVKFLNEVLNGWWLLRLMVHSLPLWLRVKESLNFFLRLWVKIWQFVRLTAIFFAGRFTANGWPHWDPLESVLDYYLSHRQVMEALVLPRTTADSPLLREDCRPISPLRYVKYENSWLLIRKVTGILFERWRE